MIFFLARNCHQGIAELIKRRFVSSPDQKTATATGRIYVPADFDTI